MSDKVDYDAHYSRESGRDDHVRKTERIDRSFEKRRDGHERDRRSSHHEPRDGSSSRSHKRHRERSPSIDRGAHEAPIVDVVRFLNPMLPDGVLISKDACPTCTVLSILVQQVDSRDRASGKREHRDRDRDRDSYHSTKSRDARRIEDRSDHPRSSERVVSRARHETRDAKDAESSRTGSSRTEQEVESRGRSSYRRSSRSRSLSNSSSTSSSSSHRKSSKHKSSKRRRDDSLSPDRSRDDSRDRRSSHSKRKDRSRSRDRDRKKRHHKDKDRHKRKEERRSALTGKKVRGVSLIFHSEADRGLEPLLRSNSRSRKVGKISSGTQTDKISFNF